MTETTIGNFLPSDFGATTAEAATLLLHANRQDAITNYNVDKDFFDKNPKLGKPIDEPDIGLPVLPGELGEFEYIGRTSALEHIQGGPNYTSHIKGNHAATRDVSSKILSKKRFSRVA